MPGPCNTKRKRKAQKKKSRATQHDEHDAPCTELDGHDAPHTEHDRNDAPCAEYNGDDALLAGPNVYDPGTGPRVRNAKAFLASYFAQPPSLDDALCAEFAQEEILEMLCTVLCEDLAMVLWYNKSRATGRICPSCRRLYRLGDALPDLIQDGMCASEPCSPYLVREQQISGLCSPLCFIMASFDHPSAIKTTWGRVADEMDETTWAELNGPGSGSGDPQLTLLLKMTRLDDLGLGEMCLSQQ